MSTQKFKKVLQKESENGTGRKENQEGIAPRIKSEKQ